MGVTSLFVWSVLAVSALPASTVSAQVLFPRPLHLAREIEDPFASRSVRIDEYFAGDRAITIRGDRTVIADYGKQELTEIDRRAGTYSVTPFTQLAAARPVPAAARSRREAAASSVRRSGSDRRAGRDVELFTADDETASLHVEVAIDPSWSLSRPAFDVVTGAAFPGDGGPAADLTRAAATQKRTVASTGVPSHASGVPNIPQAASETYGLPLEQKTRWRWQGETMEVTSRVVSVDDHLPPAELLSIPAGAKRVEGRAIAARRVAADADALVPSDPGH
ncbi:MAG: hypothetical protein ABI837_14580 [Acidobacteriota bacterium]